MSNFQGHFEDSSGNILLPIPSGATATVENTNIARQNYSPGSFLYFQNRLCRVTQTIASGNTLEVGVNLSYTTIGVEMTSHFMASDGTEFTLQDYLDGNYS